jgi:3-hydroxyisobutyrate dehydrogenase
MDWLDAPVSGGAKGAEEGSLAIMVGGEAEAVARARPAIEVLAGNLTHMGPSGAGQTTKLCNQIIVASQMAAIGEAVKLAEAGGVDAARLPEALKGGWADSKPLQAFVPRMAAREFDPPLGATTVMLKDLDTVAALAKAGAVPIPLTATVAELMRILVARGDGDQEPMRMIQLSDPPRSE